VQLLGATARSRRWPLKGVIDFGLSGARFDNELQGRGRYQGGSNSKLANEKFVANAPEEIVEEVTRKA